MRKVLYSFLFMFFILNTATIYGQTRNDTLHYFIKYGNIFAFGKWNINGGELIYEEGHKSNYDSDELSSVDYTGKAVDIGVKKETERNAKGIHLTYYYDHDITTKGGVSDYTLANELYEYQIIEKKRYVNISYDYEYYWKAIYLFAGAGIAYVYEKKYPEVLINNIAGDLHTETYTFQSILPVIDCGVGLRLLPGTKFQFLLELKGITSNPFFNGKKRELNGGIFNVGINY
jgi:hypothetical protein